MKGTIDTCFFEFKQLCLFSRSYSLRSFDPQFLRNTSNHFTRSFKHAEGETAKYLFSVPYTPPNVFFLVSLHKVVLFCMSLLPKRPLKKLLSLQTQFNYMAAVWLYLFKAVSTSFLHLLCTLLYFSAVKSWNLFYALKKFTIKTKKNLLFFFVDSLLKKNKKKTTFI